jgi:hypothetical protein
MIILDDDKLDILNDDKLDISDDDKLDISDDDKLDISDDHSRNIPLPSKIILINFPNLELLLLDIVFALPNASKIGFVANIKDETA